MEKIRWTKLAEEDLRFIFEFISFDSKKYAAKQIDKIITRASILEFQPTIGRIVPEFNKQNIRELIEGNYRIIYRIKPQNEISILRIHHSARQLKNL